MRGRLMARGALLLMLAALVAWPAAAQSPESSEAAQAASNILVNGSFDGGLEGWETWTPRGNPEIRYDETVYRSAPGSIRVEGFAPNDRAALVQRPAVEPGKWYTISAWVKTENVSGDAVRLRVQFNLATDPTQKTREHLILGRLGGSRDWTLLQETFQVPPGTGTLTIEPFLDGGQGVVWWDDIVLTPAEEKRLSLQAPQVETLSSGTVRLRWSVEDFFAGAAFEVYRSTEPEFDASDQTRLARTDRLEFIDRDTEAHTTYYYKIVPFDRDGHAGEASEILVAHVGEVAKVQPVARFFAEWSAAGIHLTWELSDFTRARQVRLERGVIGADGAVSWSLLDHTPAWVSEFVDTALPAGIAIDRVRYRATVVSPEGEAAEPAEVLVTGMVAKRERAVPVGEHPTLFVTAQEIEQLKAAAATNPGIRLLLENDVIRPGRAVAQVYLPREVSLPAKGDNSGHQNLAVDARQAALAYAFTGERELAEAAKKILLAYAHQYKNYPLHLSYDGRVTTQTLNESPWLIELVWAYDLILSSGVLSPEEQALIEEDLLWEAVRVIERYRRGRSNWQAWHNAAIGAVAFVLNDPEWIETVIDGPQGFTYHIREGLRDDGLWWEQAIGYHDYTRRALVYLAEAAWRNGYDLYSYTSRGKSLKLAFDAVFYHAFTDGLHPVVGNTSPSSRLQADWTFGPGILRYGDPRYAWLVRKSGGPAGGGLPRILYLEALQSAEALGSLTLGLGSFAPAGFNVAGSTLFADTGMALLRAQSGAGQGLELAMLYKPHGTQVGHQAADNLTIMLEGPGGRWLSGPGSYNYDLPEQGSWYKQSVARSGVVIDETSQHPQGVSDEIFASDRGRPSSGQLLHFVALPSLGLVAAATDRVYPDAAMERTFLLSADYGIDRYQVSSPRERQVDWVLNIVGTEDSISVEQQPQEGPLGSRAGYQHIENVRIGETDAAWHGAWRKSDGSALHVTMLGGEPTEVIRAHGLTKQPMLIARRQAAETEFVSVIQPAAPGGARLEVRPYIAEGLRGVEVIRAVGAAAVTDRLVWKEGKEAGEAPGVVRLESGERFSGKMAYFRGRDDEHDGAVLVLNGTMAAAGAVEVATEASTDFAVQWSKAGAVVTQSGAAAVRVHVRLPFGDGWRVYRIVPEGKALEAVAAELVHGVRAGEGGVSWIAEPRAVYLVATEAPSAQALSQFVIEVR